jgi:radical SAM protein with 4Fe4S-binding SPASM domain
MVRIKFFFEPEPEEYEKRKRAMEIPSIKQLYFDVTYECPYYCQHCYAKPARKLEKELTTDEIKSFFEYLIENDVTLVTLSGGEPLLREDILEIGKFGNELGLHLSLITTGPITKNKIRSVEKAGFKRIQFSLDGASSETHEVLKRGSSFNDTLIGIKEACKTKMRVSVCTMIQKYNYPEILKIYEKVKSLGVAEYRLMRFIPQVNRKKDYIKNRITVKNYRDLLEKLMRRYTKENPLRVDIQEPYPYALDFKGTEAWDFIVYTPCMQGKTVCAVAADGAILPCPIANAEQFIGGNIRRDDLIKCWNESTVYKNFRDVSEIPVCKECDYKDPCVGGCRCAGFGFYERTDAPDPMCPLVDHREIDKTL